MGPEEFMRPKVWSRRNGMGPAGMRMLCAAALSVLALCRPSAASEPTIVMEGNRRIDAQAIREHFHASSEALVTPAAIDAALKELYETGLFEDVKIVRSGTRLIVTVVEAPVIERVRFEGNRQVKDKDLAKEITLKPRGAMTKAAVREDVARIIENYHRNCRYQVEGTRYRFGTIEIQPHIAALDQSGLRNAVHLVQGNIFDGEAVGKAVDAIAVAAGKRGFPFVDVRPHANRDSAANVINVVFTLDDGPRRYVERINIHGNTFTRDEAIRRDLFFKETLANPTQSYGSESYGAGVKVSAPLMDGVTSEAHYALVNQSVSLSPTLMECIPPNASTTCPSVAVKQAALNGAQWVSTVGSTLTYSSLDNPKSPHDGLRAELRQDVASLPGTVDFLRTTGDVRYYRDLGNDVVGLIRAHG